MNQPVKKDNKTNTAITRSASCPRIAPVPAPGSQRLTSTTTNRIRVLVADDHPVVRKGLVFCLANHSGIEVVGEARDGREALQQARQLTPDVLLMDLNMPHMTGLAVTETLQKELPRVKILVLSTHNTAECVLRVLRSGARGYVLKEAPAEQLVQAIEKVQAGDVFFSPQVAHLALNHFVRRTAEPNTQDLSNRERDILTGIAEGLSNKEIACRLDIGTRTVETHRERLMRKLQIRTIAGLTKFAILNGMVPFPEMVLSECKS